MENDKSHEPDKRIRAKLDAYEPKPDAALWHDIERELDKSKRRGGFFRKRYLLLLLLFLLGGIGVFVIDRRGDIDTARTNKTETNGVAKRSPSPSDNSHQGVTPENKSATNFSNDERKTAVEQSVVKESTSHDKTLKYSSGAAAANSNANSPLRKQSSNGNKTNGKSQSNNHTAFANKRQSDTDNHQAVDQRIKTNDSNTNAVSSDARSNQQIDPTTSTAANDQSNNHQGVETNVDTALNYKTSQNETSYANTLTTSDSTAITHDTTAKIIEEAYAVAADKTKRAVKFYGGPFFQYNVVSKTIDTDNNAPAQYLERRRAEETNATALSFGLKIGADVNRFSVQSGIGLRSYADDVQYNNRQLCYDIVNTGSQALPLYDTVSVHSEVSNVIGTRNGKAINRYVELPLMVGYRIGSGGLFVRPMFGLALALPVSWSSYYIDESVTDLFNPDAQLKPVLNLTGEVTASQALAKNFYLDFGLNYNRNLSNLFIAESGIRQRYTSWGGHLGLTFGF